ncbi:MAG: hypothetical protein HYZ28_24835 [Myxococcales bacterium]|nr:hypothetical protein [Myxococcales bacterium]
MTSGPSAGTPSNSTATPTLGTTAATRARTSTGGRPATCTSTVHEAPACPLAISAPRTSSPALEISASKVVKKASSVSKLERIGATLAGRRANVAGGYGELIAV